MSEERKTINWGFIGASTWARRFLIPIVRDLPEARPMAVYSSDPRRGGEFAANCGLARSYSTLDALLGDQEIDAVYVSSTNQLHAEQTIAAAEAGKHTLCEKPMALNLSDARAMCATCHRAGVVLATNHAFRAAPAVAAMRQMIQQGAIGEVVAARVNSARYLLDELQTWRLDRPDLGAGVIFDVTVHDADTIRFLLDDEVAEVTAFSANQGLAQGRIEDGVMGVMRMSRGQLISFHDAFTVPHAGTGLEVHGSTGSLIARDALEIAAAGELVLRRGNDLEPVNLPPASSIYVESVRRFHAAIRGQGPPLANGEDGIASLAVALAVAESANSRHPVSPAKQ